MGTEKRKIEETILYEDKDILVCRKPGGLPVQTRKIGMMDMESMLKNYLAAKGENPYLAVIHRLDQPVQGILVFGKNQRSGARLSEEMQKGEMRKIYLACVRGIPENQEGTLEHQIEKVPGSNLSRIVEKKTKNSKKAVLEYKVLKEENGCSLLEIHLKTGRHHQIRIQLAHAGWPILGDTKYNEKSPKGEWEELGLCASRLSFYHPTTGKKMEFQVKPDGNFPIV